MYQHGASVNAMDLWQFTPLHEAASKNRVEVCLLLLAHGADPTLVNCHSKSAIDVAPTPELRERLQCECLCVGGAVVGHVTTCFFAFCLVLIVKLFIVVPCIINIQWM